MSLVDLFPRDEDERKQPRRKTNTNRTAILTVTFSKYRHGDADFHAALYSDPDLRRIKQVFYKHIFHLLALVCYFYSPRQVTH